MRRYRQAAGHQVSRQGRENSVNIRHPSVRIVFLTILASNLLPPSLATAEEGTTGLLPIPNYSADLFHRSKLSGDWGGTRTDLANRGIQFEIDWTQYVQGVVDGGVDRTTQYGGHLDYLIRFDLKRMDLAPGILTIRAETRYGNSVNSDVGTILPVNTTAAFPLTASLDDEVPITITNLSYST